MGVNTTTPSRRPSPPGPLETPMGGLVPASIPGQIAAMAVCLLAMGLLGAAADEVTMSLVCALVFIASIVFGLALESHRWFGAIAGWVAGPLVAVALLVVTSVVAIRADFEPPLLFFVVVAVAVIGLDWFYVSRLRAAVIISGVFVIPVVGMDAGWALPAAMAWFAGAILTIAFLDYDARRALPRPEPLVTQTGPQPPVRSNAIAPTIGLAVLAGLLIALLIGNPSCSRDTERSTSFGGGSGQFDPSDPSGGPNPTNPTSGEDQPYFAIDEQGREIALQVDEYGRTYFEDSNGERFYCEFGSSTGPGGGDAVVVTDENGDIVAALGGDGNGNDQALGADDDGNTQVFDVEEDDSLSFTGGDGRRYFLESDDGEYTLRDDAGQPVGGAQISDDHLYIEDPDGQILIPSEHRDSGIPLPPAALQDEILDQPEGRTTESSGDETIVRDPDGTSRTYGTDDLGREQVTVTDSRGDERTYVYDTSGDHTYIYEYDENDRFVRNYVVDPEGRSVGQAQPRSSGGSRSSDGSGSSGNNPDDITGPSGGASADGTPPTTAASAEGDDGGGVNWWLIGGAVAGLVAVGLATWLLTRPKSDDTEEPAAGPIPDQRTWAQNIVHALEVEGAMRNRPRLPAESIVDYGAALGASVLADARLTEAARIVSGALFGRTQPSMATRAWVDSVVAEAVERNPLPEMVPVD